MDWLAASGIHNPQSTIRNPRKGNVTAAARVDDGPLLKTFRRLPLELARGEDVFVFDVEGRKYHDFYAGHAVASKGDGHRRGVKAFQGRPAELLLYATGDG